MCYIISSTGRTGRTPFAKACNGMTAKEAKSFLVERRRAEMRKEHDTFEQWQRLLLRNGEFSVDALDKAKRFADFLTRAKIKFDTLPKNNGFTTFKLV